MRNNVLNNKKYCFGCGVCTISCPKKIIKISLDQDGFYFPYIEDEDDCVECGICSQVCAFDNHIHEDIGDIKGFAAWSNNENTRLNCSSGGVSYELLKAALRDNYDVIPVRYNVLKNRAEHYLCDNIENLNDSIGSKYIQSDFTTVLSHLNYNNKYVVVGTPCQIHSFRTYIRKKRLEQNFILIDFFCHGVPSMNMWDKYIHEFKRKSRCNTLEDVSWREKQTGWHNSWGIKILSDDTQFISRWSDGDLFYKLFLGHFCLNQACHTDCKYKMLNSAADIRLGDLWGSTYAKDEKGVSGVIAFTDRGYDLLQQSDIQLVPHDISVVTEGQMKYNAKPAYMRWFTMLTLRNKKIGLRCVYLSIFTEFLLKLPNRIFNKIFK